MNPDNRPEDEFKRNAIQAFNNGKCDRYTFQVDQLRYAAPLRITDASCLMCHIHNVGDLLGGVSYRAPLTGGAAK